MAHQGPIDFAHLYETAWAKRVSLKTSDLAEANRLAAQHQAHWLNVFADQRRHLNPQRIESLTPELLRTIKDAIRHQVLQDDLALRFDNDKLRDLCLALEALVPTPVYLGPPGKLPGFLDPAYEPWWARHDPHWRKWAMLDRLNEVNAIISQRNTTALFVTGDRARAQMFADGTTKRMGFLIDWTRPENSSHLLSILEATTSAWADTLERHKGKFVQTPEKPTAPTIETAKPPAIKRTIMDAFGAWQTNEVKRPPKTVSGAETAAKLFGTLMLGRTLEGLTEEDGHALVNALKQWAHDGGKTQTTAANNLLYIGAILAVAHRKKWCPVNPVACTT